MGTGELSCSLFTHHNTNTNCQDVFALLYRLCVPTCAQNEDFSSADAVYDCIGEAGEERFSLAQLEQLLDSATVKA